MCPLVWWLVALSLFGFAGCASTMQCQDSPDPLEAQRCMPGGGATEAAGSAGASAVAWGVTGCRTNGCNRPYVCNQDNGLCEVIRCAEGLSCPEPFTCDLDRGECE